MALAHRSVVVIILAWTLASGCRPDQNTAPAGAVLKPTDLKGFPASIQRDIDPDFLSDEQLLRAIAADTWRFFEKSSLQRNNLIADHIWVEPPRIGAGTSVTNIGLHILAIISAVDLGLISSADATDNIGRVLDTVERLPTYNGYVYNWYNLVTLEPLGPFISTVDLAWYYAALAILAGTFPVEFGQRCDRLIHQIDFSWLYDESLGHFYHGYNAKDNEYSPYHYSLLYSEARIISYLAMARGDISVNHWYHLQRTLPRDVKQQQIPEGDWSEVGGVRYFKGYYSYNSQKIIPSWGGSLFEYFSPGVLLNEQRLAALGVGANLVQALAIHMDYAIKRMHYPVWGLAPSSTPAGAYGEFGVAEIGAMIDGYPAGVITPYASILALAYDPEAVIGNIRRLLELYPIYGEYGFYDCVDPTTGTVGYSYLALDQGLILLSLNNYLNDEVMTKRFQQLPGMGNVFQVVSSEQAF